MASRGGSRRSVHRCARLLTGLELAAHDRRGGRQLRHLLGSDHPRRRGTPRARRAGSGALARTLWRRRDRLADDTAWHDRATPPALKLRARRDRVSYRRLRNQLCRTAREEVDVDDGEATPELDESCASQQVCDVWLAQKVDVE